MPELRQNLATKDWVIIANERSLRPDQFRRGKDRKPAAPAGKWAECPFCPGNDSLSETVQTFGDPTAWKVRSVKNKFPALIAGAPQPAGVQKVYRSLPGEGIHEVIIDSPSHSKDPAQLSQAEMVSLLGAYRERFNVISRNEKISLTLIFKNHGEAAGTSIEHPHTQIVGSSVVPSGIRHRMDEAEKYFRQNSACVFCHMIEEEKRQGVRMLADSRNFAAFVLFAALSPFHIWILPERHTPGFGEITDVEISDLSKVLLDVLRRIDQGLGGADYNFVIQSAPLDRGTLEPYHWYLSLVVRLSKAAGFELGSGMFINTAIPEESAAFLKSVKL